jgi:heat shock protein HtpX
MSNLGTSASSSDKTVLIETEIPYEAVAGFATFFESYYVQFNRSNIDQNSYRKMQSGGTITFVWKLVVHNGNQEISLNCQLQISKASIKLHFRDLDGLNKYQAALLESTIDGVRNLTQSYLQNLKMTSLYFVVGSAEEEHTEAPTEEGSTQRSFLRRIFSGSSTNVFLLFTLISFFLFFIIGIYGLFFLLASQFVYLVYSDRVALNIGNVRPSVERPLVSVVSVACLPETVKFLKQNGKSIMKDIREDVSKLHLVYNISSSSSASAGSATTELKSSILAILSKYGIKVKSADDVDIKTKNVYEIVKRVATKFGQSVPKIVIANTVVSNAAANGISASHSSIMITAGSLIDLTDEELEAIVGHELGHIKGHDPTIMFLITSFQFIGMFYLWYPLVEYLGLLYFVLAFWVIFAFGKILETRADTESAIILQDPGAVASSLTKMGFRELYREKYSPGARLLDWFRFDPHPPTYFRINRMSEFASGTTKIHQHAFLISLRDLLTGFFSSVV